MNKKDCKIGMFVAVLQNTSPLAKSRTKVKRIGKITGIYGDYVNLLLFNSDFKGEFDFKCNRIYPEVKRIKLHRKLYISSFRFSEIFKIESEIIYEER